ncbi:MAG: hypothetical protein WBF34_38770 [Streptosporangiaceae bacterium]|jgi:hypothetical protein
MKRTAGREVATPQTARTTCSPTTPSPDPRRRPRQTRAVNNLAIAALIATYAATKKIVDQSAARAAISEVISAE